MAGPRHHAPLPTADAEIRLSDFAFTSGDIAAGTHTFHVVNDGPQIHEIQLVRLMTAPPPRPRKAIWAECGVPATRLKASRTAAPGAVVRGHRASNWPMIASATSIPVARCRPSQPGMPFTSST